MKHYGKYGWETKKQKLEREKEEKLFNKYYNFPSSYGKKRLITLGDINLRDTGFNLKHGYSASKSRKEYLYLTKKHYKQYNKNPVIITKRGKYAVYID